MQVPDSEPIQGENEQSKKDNISADPPLDDRDDVEECGPEPEITSELQFSEIDEKSLREQADRRSKRDSLHVAIAQCWPGSAWRVERVQAVEDVQKAFRTCTENDRTGIIRLLRTEVDSSLRTRVHELVNANDTERAALKLNELRVEINGLNDDLARIGPEIIQVQQKLQKAELIIRRQCTSTVFREPEDTADCERSQSPSHVSRINSILRQIAVQLRSEALPSNRELHEVTHTTASKLDDLEKYQSQAITKRNELSKLLFNAEAHFTQLNVLQLIKDGRYKTISPRILANAIAGSPEMSYRRSSDLFTRIPSIVSTYVEKNEEGEERVKFHLSTRAERVEFELLGSVKQLVRKYRAQSEELKSQQTLFDFTDKWVDRLRKSTSAAEFLRDNKPAFLKSIARVEKRNIKNPEAEPYAILRFFWYLLRNKSPEKQLLDELRELKY